LAEALGELDVEVDEQVALEGRIVEERQTHLDQSLDAARVDQVVRLALHLVLAAVQEGELAREAAEGLLQSDFECHGEVGLFALKDLVFLLLDGDDDVSRVAVGLLVRLALEDLLLSVGDTPVQADLDAFFFADDFLEFAFFASLALGDNGALALALVAVLGGLGDHPRTQLHDAGDLAAAFAVGALGCAFASSALAVGAEFEAFYHQLLGLTCKDLLQGDLHFIGVVLSLFSATLLALATASHEHAHQVVHAAASAAMAAHDSLFSTHVLEFAFLGVGEHVIGLRHLLEQVFVTSSVGVVFKGTLPKSFFYIVRRSIFRHS